MSAMSNRDFAAEAERARRDGEPGIALDIARGGLASAPGHTAGRVAAGLALLDLGRVGEARAELEAIVHIAELPVSAAPDDPLSGLAEDELEQAFEEAAAEPDTMVDAEGIALQTVAAVERAEVDAGPELPGEAFRTHSMARLLEEQGDEEAAEAIRRELGDDEHLTEPPPEVAQDELRAAERAPRRTREPGSKSRVEVLERWLHNVRRGRA